MKRQQLLVQRTLQSLLKYGAFLLVIMMVVYACGDSEEQQETPFTEPTANLTAKTDGAIMGSVIAPNAEILIVATDSDKTFKGKTDDNGEFFITGLQEGTYEITISDEITDREETFEDVIIRIGEVTALGTVELALD
ncbi:carboxypeptidase regulatory-like domain-containing protein [Rasiella rasia]|uniref:Carboxypeptidase regulatory-like domain-containing protein n=1 Tax=Rasiella rasia TaxID=2744027 RepID=A0A6G6GN91_9FLAO|nr:carboxypeptidase-like regulatory domain-containing protein [Rasiella rasia]QIE60022.1 carboxypeptidase regulatory-like domain-containing protein [Rasiella rasia]